MNRGGRWRGPNLKEPGAVRFAGREPLRLVTERQVARGAGDSVFRNFLFARGAIHWPRIVSLFIHRLHRFNKTEVMSDED